MGQIFTFCFVLHHGILFKLIKLNKATHGKLKLGKQNPSQFSKTKYNPPFGKTHLLLSLQIVQETQGYIL